MLCSSVSTAISESSTISWGNERQMKVASRDTQMLIFVRTQVRDFGMHICDGCPKVCFADINERYCILETICWSQEHSELKWIAGFFYWINEVQEYDSGGWNYINELRSFVDGGMVDDGFINAVSGIVNRGCHNPVSIQT